jgi:hypothetical protein
MNKLKSVYETELIEIYLEGKLHGDELERFISKINADEEFAEDVKLHREINEFLKEYVPLIIQLERCYEKVILKKRKSTPKRL